MPCKSRLSGRLGGLGFTLIELLVVVLIIGILAAIAVPQYQKAVEKSKAAQALVTLKSLQTAFNAYYLANGAYPLKFADVVVSLPSMTGHEEQLRSPNTTLTDTISDKDWSLQIQQDASTPLYIVTMARISGNYKGGTFSLHFVGDKAGKIFCYERAEGSTVRFPIAQAGSYCQKIMKGTFLPEYGNEWGRYYSI